MARSKAAQTTPRQWITIQQAADRLGVTPKTIRNFIARGGLHGYRIGAHMIRVRSSEVDALLRPIPAVEK